MTPRLTLTNSITAALVALLVVACISERQSTTGPSVANGNCRIPVGSPLIGTTRAFVAIRNFAFGPDTLRVVAGTTVTWINCDEEGTESHTSTSDSGLWESLFLAPGDFFSYTFEDPGQFPYYCVPHPFMRAVVIVQ
jgi:plastocyanin